jgi:subtilase family serine protease
MKVKLFPMATGVVMLALLPLSTRAADRLTLSSRVPTEARRQMLGRLPATDRLRLAVGLPLRNQELMTNLLQQLYDPRSTNFHHFLTPEQFADQFGPTEQAYQSVIAYAQSNHLQVVRTFGNRALVNVEGNVADLETMFHVHLGTYQHPTEPRQFYAPDVEPTVDSGAPVLYVSGLDNYIIPGYNGHRTDPDKIQGPLPNGAGGSSPTNGDFLGSDFRHAYVPGTTLTGSGQVVGLFERDGYTASDISTYETFAGLSSVPLNNILNTYSPGTGNSEVASDIELAIAMAPGLAAVNVYEDTDNATIVNEMASPTTGEIRPNQISCSWNVSGDTTMEQGLIQLAFQGQSFMYAVGDSGAYQNGVNGGTQQDFIYMTAVGGTQLFMTNSGAAWQSEIVWHDPPGTNFQYFSSTGGVLTAVPIPSYQQGVSMALNQGSTQYRNVPDVALVARDIQIVYTGTNANGSAKPGVYSGWVGTSAAAPLFAGLIALANQQAAQQGKPPVGFLNPSIYEIAESSSYSSCFHDITSGNNSWNNISAGTSSGGLYSAATGYDLCTGWGTSASTNLINALVGLAGPIFVNFSYPGNNSDGGYDRPFKTVAQGVSAVGNSGTIFIVNGGSSAETMTISKPMRIDAINGAANVGN